MVFPVTMPKLSPTMEKGTIAKWHKKEGDYVKAQELLVEIATDKATLEHSAIDPGWLRKILIQEGDETFVNDPIAIFSEKQDEPIDLSLFTKKEKKALSPTEPSISVQRTPSPKREFIEKSDRIKASPLAKKLAREQDISLALIRGTGPSGRIMSRDLPKGMAIQGTPLSPMRKVIAKRMQEAKATIPHFYLCITVDAAPLFTKRAELKEKGSFITINDFIIKATASALMEFPAIRASFFQETFRIYTHEDADIAVAVSVPGGLVTPIIKKAQEKSLQSISSEIKQLSEKARSGKLLPEEYTGGAFTITNIGMYGVTDFFPIINPPQVAILAVGAAYDTPVIKDGQVIPGKAMRLTLACDHRALDGKEAGEFLKGLKGLLEKPEML